MKLSIFEIFIRNAMKIFKTTGGIQHHPGSERLKKTTELENSLIFRQERA